MYRRRWYNESKLMNPYSKFWIDLLKGLIQASYAGLFIAPLVQHEFSLKLFVGLVAVIFAMLYWVKKLCEQNQVSEGAKND